MSSAAKPATFGSDLRSALVAMVRRRVPESEVEDIVQSALAEAIESPHAPAESESLRRWVFGVAKNKVVDYHRRAGRESFDLPDVPGTPAPHVEADFLRWAERNLPEGAENEKTLDWMLREGEGEKLESIAASEKLPPPRVRQRVSRLRRHFKENWRREVALLAALGVIVSTLLVLVVRKPQPEPIAREVVDPRAEPVRRLALEKCSVAEWKSCVEGLDEAKRLDPVGDARPEVRRARQAAENAAKAPSPEPTGLQAPAPPPSATPLPVTAPPPSSFPAPPMMKSPAKTDATTPVLPRPPSAPTKAKPQSKQAEPSRQFGAVGFSSGDGSDFGGGSLGGASGPPTNEAPPAPKPKPAPKPNAAGKEAGFPQGTKK